MGRNRLASAVRQSREHQRFASLSLVPLAFRVTFAGSALTHAGFFPVGFAKSPLNLTDQS